MYGDVKHAAAKCLFLVLGLLAPAIGVGQAKVTITTTTLPTGTVSVSYSQALSTSGGKAPYTWSVSAGALPGGLSLSAGTISGTPSSRGTFQFTVRVLDGAGDTDTQPLTIIVNSNPVITTETLPNAIAGSSYTATLAVSGAVSRSARYSRRYRPAWRISQIGVCDTGSRANARSSVSFCNGLKRGACRSGAIPER